MDKESTRRQLALRARAEEAIEAALAAADARVPELAVVVADAMAAVDLSCWDPSLGPGDRLALIDDALRLMGPLKELVGAAHAARPALVAQVYRRTNDLLRRYAQLVPRPHA
jgi:hypothetical protein